MSRASVCDKKAPCVHCGNCCALFVCGYAMDERHKRGRRDNIGPCEFAREVGEDVMCGIYLSHMEAGRRVRASIVARDLHFGKGCTNAHNHWRQNKIRQEAQP